jgi:phosphate transport system permease protein
VAAAPDSGGGPNRATPSPAKKVGHRAGDTAFHYGTAAVALLVLAAFAVLVAILVDHSELAFTTFGPGFPFGTTWNANAHPPLYGGAPFLEGTLVTSGVALVFGVPLSLGIAIFMAELAPTWLRDPMASLVEMLAAIPSVIYGLWGLFVLAPYMRNSVEPLLRAELGWSGLFTGTIYGLDKFTAGVVLAIMIIPTIAAVSREAMVAVPVNQREAALSLGATRWETTRLGVLRYARSGIVAGVILGLGRALGETMAVTMTIGNSNAISTSLLAPGQTVASWIANEFLTAATTPREQSALLELGLILLGITVLVNVVAVLFLGRSFRPEEARE